MIYNDIEITALGHDGFKIDFKGIIIYIDPYEITQTDKASLILITHEHYDHCSPTDIYKVTGEDTLIVAPKSAAAKLKGNIRVIKTGEQINIGVALVEAVHAYNTDKPFHPRGLGVGYVININNTRIYHSGDTDIIPEMNQLKDIDIAMLPVSGTYVMNADEAAEAAETIKPKIAIPMHYGAIVGNLTDAEIFAEQCSCKVEILSTKKCQPGDCGTEVE